MPYLLRNIRKAKWYKNPNVAWLPDGELQADALVDLKTDNNELSVWYIEDDKLNLEQVISALTANRAFVSSIDYALIDLQDLSGLNLKIEKTEGDSPDKEANATWHRDVTMLTVPLIVGLARTIQTEAEIERIAWKKVVKWIANGVSSGRINRKELKAGVLVKVNEYL